MAGCWTRDPKCDLGWDPTHMRACAVGRRGGALLSYLQLAGHVAEEEGVALDGGDGDTVGGGGHQHAPQQVAALRRQPQPGRHLVPGLHNALHTNCPTSSHQHNNRTLYMHMRTFCGRIQYSVALEGCHVAKLAPRSWSPICAAHHVAGGHVGATGVSKQPFHMAGMCGLMPQAAVLAAGHGGPAQSWGHRN